MSWFWQNKISKEELKNWVISYVYRCDAGLWELELEYKKKKIFKKLKTDRTYNQLWGKFVFCVALIQDFHIPFQAGTRIMDRIKRVGGKVKIVGKKYAFGCNPCFYKGKEFKKWIRTNKGSRKIKSNKNPKWITKK